MSALLGHIQKQQDTACTLCGVLDAIGFLDSEGYGRGGAVTSLIQIARRLAEDLNRNLDTTALPEGGEA